MNPTLVITGGEKQIDACICKRHGMPQCRPALPVSFADALGWYAIHRVMIEGSGKTWKQDQRVRIQHVDTGAYLHSHDKKYQRIAGGQQEVRIMKSNPIFQISDSK